MAAEQGTTSQPGPTALALGKLQYESPNLVVSMGTSLRVSFPGSLGHRGAAHWAAKVLGQGLARGRVVCSGGLRASSSLVLQIFQFLVNSLKKKQAPAQLVDPRYVSHCYFFPRYESKMCCSILLFIYIFLILIYADIWRIAEVKTPFRTT